MTDLYAAIREALQRRGHYDMAPEAIMAAADAIKEQCELAVTIRSRGLHTYMTPDRLAAMAEAMKESRDGSV